MVILLVPAGADGDADEVQGEEEDGPDHAKPTCKERSRERYLSFKI